jgi:hypothetical protein
MRMYTESEPPRRGIVSLRMENPFPRRRNPAGGIVSLVIAIILGWWLISAISAASPQQVQITTCNTLDQCYQTTVPVQSQVP